MNTSHTTRQRKDKPKQLTLEASMANSEHGGNSELVMEQRKLRQENADSF